MPVAVLPTLVLALALGAVDFQVVAPILAPIAADLGVEVPRAGLLVTSYALGSAIAAPLFAGAVARRGAVPFLRAGLWTLSGGIALCAAAPSYAALLVARAVAGIGGGLAMTMCHVYVAQAVPYAERGRVAGWLGSGFFAASIVGVPLGAFLTDAVSWRATFVLLAAATIAADPLVARLPRPAVEPDGIGAGLGAILRTRGVAAGLAAFVLLAAGISSITTYVGAWSESRFGVSTAGVGLLYMLGGLGALAAGPIGGRLADRFGKRPVAVGANLCVAALLALLPRLASIEAVAAAFAGKFLAASCRFPAMISMLGETVPAGRRGPLLLLNHTAILLGMAAGSWAGAAVLSARGFPAVGAGAAALTLGIVGLLFRLPDPGRGGPVDESALVR